MSWESNVGESTREARGRKARIHQPLAAALAVAMAASGCSLLPTGDTGSETVAETSTTVAETTDTTAAESTETTVATDEPANDAPAENTDVIPMGATFDQILGVVEDVHGPTTNISAQINRIVTYPELPTPAGAFIAGIYARVATTFDDDNAFTVWSEADFFADGTTDDLVVFYETQLPPLGWNLTKTATDTRFDGAPITVLTFEIPNDDFALRQELEVTVVEDPDLPELLVETRYTGAETTDRAFIERFLGWYDPSIVPEGGQPFGVILDTRAGEGRTDLSIDTEYRYEGPTEAELLSDLEDRAAGSGLEPAETFRDNAVAFTVAGLDDFLYTAYEGSSYSSVTVEGDTKFVNQELETAAVEAVDKPTDPLPEAATAEQIEAIINEVHGPTIDISGQMNRLTPFPAIPTPAGSNVIELTASVNEVINNDALRAHIGEVQFRVDGTREDILVFFEAQVASLGWTEASRADESEDDGLTTKTTLEYEIEGIDSGLGAPFKLTVVDDVDKSDVIVTWRYREFVPLSESWESRWNGWYDGSPLPDDGTFRNVGVSTDGIFGQAIFFFAEFEWAEETAPFRAGVEAEVAGSGYDLDPDPGTAESRLYLTHPFFSDAYVSFFETGGGETWATLNTQRPLVAGG